MSNVLTELSAALATAVSQADSGIVRVEGRRRLGATGIVWASDGLILTANHVVRSDEHLKVGLPDGSRVSASLVGRDPSTDLAVLKVEASGLAPLTEGNKQNLGVGNLVLALGRPGRTVQATLGIVSALGDGGAPDLRRLTRQATAIRGTMETVLDDLADGDTMPVAEVVAVADEILSVLDDIDFAATGRAA